MKERPLVMVDGSPLPAHIDPTRDFVGVCDTRELPEFRYTFPSVPMVLAAMPAGDYGFVQPVTTCAVERKAIGDFVSCVATGENPRHQQQLRRLADLDFSAVVVECSIADIEAHRYYARAIEPRRVLDTAATLSVKYKVPYIFTGGRLQAAALTFRLLRACWMKGKREAQLAAKAALVASLTTTSEGSS